MQDSQVNLMDFLKSKDRCDGCIESLKLINMGVRFLLEIIALVIFGFWDFRLPEAIFTKIIGGFGVPILVAVIWGTFGSPKAPYVLDGFARLLLEIAILGLAALALYFIGWQELAIIIYGVIVIINLVLMKIWK